MDIKILCPQWGYEHAEVIAFMDKIKLAGYHGIDTWVPQDKTEKNALYDYLQREQMHIVAHQHEADGSTFQKFRASFRRNLNTCAEMEPIIINSHTGRDYFTFQQNLDLIDTALEFTAKTGIEVAHETHRGRLGYCPQMIADFFDQRSDMRITADFSHWVCVTESMLENFADTVNIAIKRSIHIHSRVGFEEGPQIADPAAPEWQYAVNNFLKWWDQIITANTQAGRKVFTITTEFGPEPYMPKVPLSNTPMVDQFKINCYMKDLLSNRYNIHSPIAT
ncbi:sugar phosphate isomerase/epimerase [Mucilaginibacter limnophilus]|uniref:Sugar phosphate isomerase/epimerase n=1 Tax=Mucilaginibacter limnophilus TaxID=1932778 RepID=A0A3S2Y0W6_9SPHI|nr:TIM barrel protein [Mucilaginibacter limnophilus]RVT97350.1 sugar phosphate isomerase/epimerase [Mucilaginibacter limnophilus]